MNSPIKAKPTIHLAQSEAELIAIQSFRYRVYNTEMGMFISGLDHADGLLRDPMDASAVHLFAAFSGQLAGAVRLNLNEVPRGLEKPLSIASLPLPYVYCSRLFVCKVWRGSMVVNALAAAAFAKFNEIGAAVAICHCYPHLMKLYFRMGFLPYAAPFVPPGLEEHGPQTPLCCRITKQRSIQAA